MCRLFRPASDWVEFGAVVGDDQHLPIQAQRQALDHDSILHAYRVNHPLLDRSLADIDHHDVVVLNRRSHGASGNAHENKVLRA